MLPYSMRCYLDFYFPFHISFEHLHILELFNNHIRLHVLFIALCIQDNRRPHPQNKDVRRCWCFFFISPLASETFIHSRKLTYMQSSIKTTLHKKPFCAQSVSLLNYLHIFVWHIHSRYVFIFYGTHEKNKRKKKHLFNSLIYG